MEKDKKKNILTIQLEVDDKLEVYKIVSELAMFHKVIASKWKNHDEKFDKKNLPFHFMKDNKKIKAKYKDIHEMQKIQKLNKKFKEI